MAHVGAMVGNSSSGLIEAPSMSLPVVNIGARQEGRLRANNVIDVPASAPAIERAVRRALSPGFRRGLRSLANPYGDGRAAERIARVLATVPLDARLIRKRFISRFSRCRTSY
jgi:UDP-N-acetylglucosamine 2-epimerase